jgi:hypothetical protein
MEVFGAADTFLRSCFAPKRFFGRCFLLGEETVSEMVVNF